MRRIALALAVLLLASCRSPDPRFYTLAPVRGAALGNAPTLIELRRPGIAGYLDRPEIVRANSPYRLTMTSDERWGEPFADMFARVLAEDLHSRLQNTTVFTSTGAISADTNARIEIDLQRFDQDESGVVQLLAQVAVTRNNNAANPVAETVRISVRPAGSSTSDYVAAMSQALGQAADRIAQMVRR